MRRLRDTRPQTNGHQIRNETDLKQRENRFEICAQGRFKNPASHSPKLQLGELAKTEMQPYRKFTVQSVAFLLSIRPCGEFPTTVCLRSPHRQNSARHIGVWCD